MPDVLFDVTPLLETHWTGIPVVTARLARLLLDDPGLRPHFAVGSRLVGTDAVVGALEAATGLYLRIDLERGRALERPRPPRIDKYFCPTVKPACGLAPSEASLVHDLSTLVTPEFHTRATIAYHRDGLARELATNDLTFAASQATADDLRHYCGLAPERIAVCHQFVDWPAEFAPLFEAEHGRTRVEPYALVIGTIEPRKNLRLVLEAAPALLAADPDLRIVILGKRGWRLEDVVSGAVGSLFEEGRIAFSGFVDEYRKYCLIRMAQFTIFPSLFEGFGIPVLESLDLGTPVLASWSSSIPEVGGEAATYFDPLSVEDFSAAFRALRTRTGREVEAARRLAARVAERFTPERFYAPVAEWLHRPVSPGR